MRLVVCVTVNALLCAFLCAEESRLNIDRPGQLGQLLYGPLSPEQGRSTAVAWHNGTIFTSPELEVFQSPSMVHSRQPLAKATSGI